MSNLLLLTMQLTFLFNKEVWHRLYVEDAIFLTELSVKLAGEQTFVITTAEVERVSRIFNSMRGACK